MQEYRPKPWFRQISLGLTGEGQHDHRLAGIVPELHPVGIDFHQAESVEGIPDAYHLAVDHGQGEFRGDQGGLQGVPGGEGLCRIDRLGLFGFGSPFGLFLKPPLAGEESA